MRQLVSHSLGPLMFMKKYPAVVDRIFFSNSSLEYLEILNQGQ